jgi:ABC-2 type transport system permease protein
MTLVFRIVRADAIASLADTFWDFNNVPMVVYGKIVQGIGVFIIPLFVITNFPALFVLGRLPTPWFIWGLAAPVIFGFISTRLWRSAVRVYASGGN